MKKIALYIVSVILVVMLGFNVYYTYEASKECRVVLTMAHNMESMGAMDNATAAHYYRAIAQSRNMVYPVNTLAHLERIHRNLQRRLDEYNRDCLMSGHYEYAIVRRMN